MDFPREALGFTLHLIEGENSGGFFVLLGTNRSRQWKHSFSPEKSNLVALIICRIKFKIILDARVIRGARFFNLFKIMYGTRMITIQRDRHYDHVLI